MIIDPFPAKIGGYHGALSPTASKCRAGIPEEKKMIQTEELTALTSTPTTLPVALNKEGQHRITSAVDFHHLQTVPIEEIVNADLAIGTGTDDPEEEKGHVEHLPGRKQSNRQYLSSGKLRGFVCSLGDFVCMPGNHWS